MPDLVAIDCGLVIAKPSCIGGLTLQRVSALRALLEGGSRSPDRRRTNEIDQARGNLLLAQARRWRCLCDPQLGLRRGHFTKIGNKAIVRTYDLGGTDARRSMSQQLRSTPTRGGGNLFDGTQWCIQTPYQDPDARTILCSTNVRMMTSASLSADSLIVRRWISG